MNIDLWLGWKVVFIDKKGMPSPDPTSWEASVFVLFTHIIYIGEVREA